MDVAANKGWRAVFAGGRWDGEGIDGGEREDGIPFVSEWYQSVWVGGERGGGGVECRESRVRGWASRNES